MKISPSLEKAKEFAAAGDYKVLPVSTELLSDFTTPIEVLRILKNVSTHCYLLESAQANETWGRYTFLGFDPKLEITCRDGNMKIGDIRLSTDDPSVRLRQILAEYKSPRIASLPPFTGGLVGDFSFDYLGYSEPSVRCNAEDTENFQDVDLMLFDKVIAFDHLRQKMILMVNMKLADPEVSYNKAVLELHRLADLAKAFENGKAFIAFLTCGDPDLETTGAAVRAAVENGADLIELGIPFSDPTAEGPVIQGANLRALRGGITTDKIFDFVRTLRRDVTVPLVFMTYANVVFSYGSDRFISTCRDVGIDGLILPDLPYEEKEEFLPYCRKYGVDLISLIAPTSENRIAMIAREAEGFLYIVSSLGVTGTRSEIKTDLASMVQVVRQNTKIPCAIGFGISTPEQAAKMAALSDGAIVGSAIVKLLKRYGQDAPSHVGDYVKSMKAAMI